MEKNLSPEVALALQETLADMGIYATETRCNCKLCIRLRALTFVQLKEKIAEQEVRLSMQKVSLLERASTDLATKDVPSHAEKKTSESHKVAG
jgi:hypothetical protein